jgi:hypothetical protein
MARKWSELVARMSPESRERAAAAAKEMMRDMPLYRLRIARGLTADELSLTLNTTPLRVLRLERRADHFLSSARKYVEAMGGRLEITARFPDLEYRLDLVDDKDGAIVQTERGTV